MSNQSYLQRVLWLLDNAAINAMSREVILSELLDQCEIGEQRGDNYYLESALYKDAREFSEAAITASQAKFSADREKPWMMNYLYVLAGYALIGLVYFALLTVIGWFQAASNEPMVVSIALLPALWFLLLPYGFLAGIYRHWPLSPKALVLVFFAFCAISQPFMAWLMIQTHGVASISLNVIPLVMMAFWVCLNSLLLVVISRYQQSESAKLAAIRDE